MCTCGHLPDPPTEDDHRTLRRLSRWVVWLQVGRVDVEGAERLAGSGPTLITPTHGHYLDPFVLAQVMPAPARCMAARGLMAFGGGVGALLFARWGAFCTDLDSGKGGPALAAAVRILVSGQTLVMFPEGWANMDGAVGRFKGGAVGVARMAASKLGRPVSIVPVHLRYGAYPGPWIRRLPPQLQCLVVLSGLLVFRRGVRIVVGSPMPSSALPPRRDHAIDALRDAVLALDPGPTSTSARQPRRVL